MSEGKNNTVMLTIIGIATLLIAVVGATFAYFSATLTGTDSEKEYTVRSATVGTEFNGGEQIATAGIYPKAEAWGTKTFSIKTTATKGVSTKYKIIQLQTQLYLMVLDMLRDSKQTHYHIH